MNTTTWEYLGWKPLENIKMIEIIKVIDGQMQLTLTPQQAKALYDLLGNTNFEKRQLACILLGESWTAGQDAYVNDIWDNMAEFYDKWAK